MPRRDLAIREPHAGPALIRRVREPPRRVDVIAEAGALLVQHAAGSVHGSGDSDAGDVLGDEHLVAGLEHYVVPRRCVAERLGQVDVDPARPVHLTGEPDPVGVCTRRETTRASNQLSQPFALGLERVRARIEHLARDSHRALQLELGLLKDQHVVEWLELYLRSACRRSGETRRTDVPAAWALRDQKSA